MNPDLMSLWHATMVGRNMAVGRGGANGGGGGGGMMYGNASPAVPTSMGSEKVSPHNSFRGTQPMPVPEKISSFMPTKAPPTMLPTSREAPVDLTLEEIFRDHNLKESTNTLESSMDTLGSETGSDLSCIFDDEEDDQQDYTATLSHTPRERSNMSSSNMSSSQSVDSTDTDVGQRFKPFHEEKWNTRLKELLQYRSEHGDCLVPHTYDKNPQLARWVKRQRRQYKLMLEERASTMTKERLDILNDCGFTWDSHEAAWQEKLSELDRFRTERGNCLVPSNYKKSPQLATWVKCQRRQYKLYWEGRASAMTPERIIQLEKIGFEWEIRSSGQSSLARSDYLYLSEAISKMK